MFVTPPQETGRCRSDWNRFFPTADHRWAMGLRRGDLARFLSPSAAVTEIRAERTHWLASEPHNYAVLTSAAESALTETIDLARSLGAMIDSTLSPWEQLLNLGRHWEADFIWLVADETNTLRVAGGVVCYPSFWALQDKLGQSLSETHRPVPGLNATLDRQIETFIDKLVPGEAWLRENAGYSSSPERNQHPNRPRKPLDATVSLEEIWIRLEHQLLLKLPMSRSLLFCIRVEVVPLLQVLVLPQAAANLIRLLTTMSPTAAEYKGLAAARELIISHTQRANAELHSEPII